MNGLDRFVRDDDIRDIVGEYLDRFCKASEMCDFFGSQLDGDGEAFNTCIVLENDIISATIRKVVERWEKYKEAEND